MVLLIQHMASHFRHNDEGTYEFTILDNSEYRVRRWDDKYDKVTDILLKKTSLLKQTDFNKITIRSQGNKVDFYK